MARIAGVDIPRDKVSAVSLTYIYGIGPTTAQEYPCCNGITKTHVVKRLNRCTEELQVREKKLKIIKLKGSS